MLYWRGTNIENFVKKFYRQWKLGTGPQHREFRKEILQAMEVGDGAPTQRNWNPNFNRQWKLAGPQHREIGTPISTGNGSWGWGPNTENFVKKFYRQCQLGITNLILLKYHFCPTPYA